MCLGVCANRAADTEGVTRLHRESGDNSLQSTEGAEGLLDSSYVEFRLRIVLGNRKNGNKITQVSTCHSGASALPETGTDRAKPKFS